MSQEECARLRESVPYVKLYRYNPKHLYPKLNSYGDNGQRSLKLWQLLLTYWLPNTYWNWQEYVVSVMLIAVRNIKVTCEWQKPLNWTTKTLALVSELYLDFQVLYTGRSWYVKLWRQSYRAVAHTPRSLHDHVSLIGQGHWTSMTSRTAYSISTPMTPTLFSGHYLRNRSTLDIGVLGYIGIV